MKDQALFIAIEGMDGSGSTTQCKKLVEFLNASGRKAILTAEPSHNESGLLLRKYLNAQRSGEYKVSKACLALLFAADRLIHYDNDIAPHLAAGTWVVSDRYVLSSLVYQGLDLDVEWVKSLNSFAPAPHHTILVQVENQVAAERRKMRGGTVEIFDDFATQALVNSRYRDMASLLHADIIDGNGDEDAVFAQLKQKFVNP